MSTNTVKEMSCPKCGHTQKIMMWASITGTGNPELRALILRERLFNWTCSECGYYALVAYPVLYHDPVNKFMVALYPSEDTPRAEAPASVAGLTKREVSSLPELKEKILIFEAGLNDIAVEILKHTMLESVRKKLGTRDIRAFFSSADTEKLEFAVFAGKSKAAYKAADMASYNRCMEILRALDYKDEPGFTVADEALAEVLLNDYKNN